MNYLLQKRVAKKVLCIISLLFLKMTQTNEFIIAARCIVDVDGMAAEHTTTKAKTTATTTMTTITTAAHQQST